MARLEEGWSEFNYPEPNKDLTEKREYDLFRSAPGENYFNIQERKILNTSELAITSLDYIKEKFKYLLECLK